jgi:hypothetical protein
VVPTKGGPKQLSSLSSIPSTDMLNAEIKNLLEQHIQMLKKMQVNSIDDKLDEEDDEELDAVDEIDDANPEDSGFFVNDDNALQVGSHNLTGTQLILDTGASKSTVSQVDLL